MTQASTVRRDVVTPGLLALLPVMVIAANLRPTLTAVGPLIGLIGRDVGLGAAALGLLGAVPLVAFAAVSPVVHLLNARLGPDRSVLVATAVLVVGTAVRSAPGTGAVTLWLGTALLSCAIAVSNVTLPALIKRDFPTEVPLVTGIYTAVLSATAALASGLALPIAQVAGWRGGIGVWGLVSVLATAVWLVRTRRSDRAARLPPDPEVALARPGRGSRSVWSSAVAWQVTGLMATQATTFYLLVTWLPSIEESRGVDPVAAGWHLFFFQVAGIVAGLAVTPFMRGRTDHRSVGLVATSALVVAVAGLVLVPAVPLVWIVLAGLSGGASLVLALALAGERTRTSTDAARVSGMSQCAGYLLAVTGPLGAGILFELTGSWTWPLLAVGLVGLLQLVVCWLAGRDRYV